MTKKDHRKILDREFFPEITQDEAISELKKVITLLNRCIHYTLKIKKGYYSCPECKSKKPLLIHPRLKSKSVIFGDSYSTIAFCPTCCGSGQVDWITKARNSQTHCDIDGVYVPNRILNLPLKISASMVFYNLFFTDKIQGVSFNSKIIHEKKTVDAFFKYFTSYKTQRDKRRKFIEKHLPSIKAKVINFAKIANAPKSNNICRLCKGSKFDVLYDDFSDEIKLKICGQCYGTGFHKKRTTKCTYGGYIFDTGIPKILDYKSEKYVFDQLAITAKSYSLYLLAAFEAIDAEEKSAILENA